MKVAICHNIERLYKEFSEVSKMLPSRTLMSF